LPQESSHNNQKTAAHILASFYRINMPPNSYRNPLSRWQFYCHT